MLLSGLDIMPAEAHGLGTRHGTTAATDMDGMTHGTVLGTHRGTTADGIALGITAGMIPGTTDGIRHTTMVITDGTRHITMVIMDMLTAEAVAVTTMDVLVMLVQ